MGLKGMVKWYCLHQLCFKNGFLILSGMQVFFYFLGVLCLVGQMTREKRNYKWRFPST